MSTRAQQAPIVLAAGGTGGHVFPAQAVAVELEARGRRLILVTDSRGVGYGGALAHIESHNIQAGTPLARGPIARGFGTVKLLLGVREAARGQVPREPKTRARSTPGRDSVLLPD